jgi:hypothetical protein
MDWRWAISGRAFFGWVLVGWGLFNVVEGAINHELLGLHHVREGAGHQMAYDLGFLAFGALLMIGGWLLGSTSDWIDEAGGGYMHSCRKVCASALDRTGYLGPSHRSCNAESRARVGGGRSTPSTMV